MISSGLAQPGRLDFAGRLNDTTGRVKKGDRMAEHMDRREFLKVSGGASAGAFLANFKTDATLFEKAGQTSRPVRIGVIGTGNRGRSLLSNLLLMPGLEFPALCDIDLDALGQARDMVVKAGRPKPEGYSKGPEDFQRLLWRD